MSPVRHGFDRKKVDKIEESYSCSEHPYVISNKSGKCIKCFRNLTISPKEKMKMEAMKIYTSSMHPEERSDKPGKCQKCGMNLIKKQ